MTTRTALVLAGPIVVIVLVLVAFGFLNAPFRQAEATAAVELLHLLGASPDRVEIRPDASVAVRGSGAFLAIVTPSCSSLASLLAVAALSLFTPRVPPTRLVRAIGCALLCVVVGNVVRIAASLGIGLVAGTGSLVLFHDWVGSLFAFAYTLGGYLLMLRILLPAQSRGAPGRRPRPRPVGAGHHG